MGRLELLWAEAAKCGVEPGSIVVDLNVLKHVRSGSLARGKPFVGDRLDLEAVVPASHRCVVVAVAPGAQARDKAALVEQVAVLARTILAAAVGVLMTPHGIFRANSAIRSASHTSVAVIQADIDQPPPCGAVALITRGLVALWQLDDGPWFASKGQLLS